jgi:tRNA(Arg) A34 adenosine deaminase TadA
MSEELKPCPFCRAKAVVWRYGDALTIASCTDCGASGDTFRTIVEPAERWNTRPIEEALQARIAELEAQVRQLKADKDDAVQETIDCIGLL